MMNYSKYQVIGLMLLTYGVIRGQDRVTPIGMQGTNEGATNIVVSDFVEGPDKYHFYIGGYVYDRGALISIDESGNIDWQYEIDMMSKNDRLSDLRLNNSHHLIGCGGDFTTDNSNAFAFEFSHTNWSAPVNPSIHWIQQEGTNRTRYHSIQQSAYDIGSDSEMDYFLTGNNNIGLGSRAWLRSLNSMGGSNPAVPLTQQFTVNLPNVIQANNFNAVVMDNNMVYMAGRAKVGGSLATSRPHLTKYDLSNYTIQDAQTYIIGHQSSGRFYGTDLCWSNNRTRLVYMAHGDDDGMDDDDYDMYVMKIDHNTTGMPYTDLMYYTFQGYETVRSKAIIALSDQPYSNVTTGYVVLLEAGEEGNSDLLVLRLNENLTAQWCKKIKSANNNDENISKNSMIVAAGDYIYFVGESNSFNDGSHTDMIFARTSFLNEESDCFEKVPVFFGSEGEFAKTALPWMGESVVDLGQMNIPVMASAIMNTQKVCTDCPEYIKRIGDEEENDGATCVIDEGNALYVAGYHGNTATLSKVLKFDGSTLWHRKLNITGGSNEQILDMTFDSDGYLVMIGKFNSPTNAFVARYDMASNSFLWTTSDGYQNTVFHSINEYKGDYLITGIHDNNQGADARIFVIDKTTGGIVSLDKTYTTNTGFYPPGHPDGFPHVITDESNNMVYLAGRVKSMGMRPHISKYDMLNQSFATINQANFYVANPNTFAQSHWTGDVKMANTSGELVYGLFNRYNKYQQKNLLLAKISTSNLAISNTRNYYLSGYNIFKMKEVIPINGGYIVYVIAYDEWEDPGDLLVLRVLENFDPVWAKSIVTLGDEDNYAANRSMVLDADAIYIVGESDEYSSNGTYDIIVAKMDYDVLPNSCFADIAVTDSVMPDVDTAIVWNDLEFDSFLAMHMSNPMSWWPYEDYPCECTELDQPGERMGNHLTQELEQQKAIYIYPNPANNVLNVEWVEEGQMNIQLFDMNGRMRQNNFNNSGGKTTIDISDVPPGMYLIRTEINGHQELTKFIKR